MIVYRDCGFCYIPLKSGDFLFWQEAHLAPLGLQTVPLICWAAAVI